MQKTLDKYVTIRQAQRLTGLSESTLRNYLDSRKVRGIRDPIGRRFLLRSDIEDLAQMRKEKESAARGA